MCVVQSKSLLFKFATTLIIVGLTTISLLSTPSNGQVKEIAPPIVRMKDLGNTRLTPLEPAPETTLRDGQLFPAPPSDFTNSKNTSGDGVIITWPFKIHQTVVAEITNTYISTANESDGWTEHPLTDLIALARVNPRFVRRATGHVSLVDGQRLPGEPSYSEPQEPGHFSWRHPWLGQINIPIERMTSVALSYAGGLALDAAKPNRDEDVVFLLNGDEVEGFILEIGSNLQIDTDGNVLEFALDQVSAIRMMPEVMAPKGKRVTFRDGTIIDVQEIRIGLDGYTRLSGDSLQLVDGMPSSSDLPRAIEINSVSFDPAEFQSLTPLKPVSVAGPPTRFYAKPPRVIDQGPDPLLSRLEMQGPVHVTYKLPPNTSRFMSLLTLEDQTTPFAHLQVVVLVDGEPRWRTMLAQQQSQAMIDIPIEGEYLSFELSEGNASSTGDRVVFTYPMLRVNSPSTK